MADENISSLIDIIGETVKSGVDIVNDEAARTRALRAAQQLTAVL